MARMEQRVKTIVLDKYKLPRPSANDDRVTGATCGESRRRADLLWIAQDRVIQVEIDEEEHKYRLPSCETAKISDSKWGLHEDHQLKPMIFIRFNPDGCQSDEEFERRCAHLVDVVLGAITKPIADVVDVASALQTTVYYLYYSDTNKHVLEAKKHDQFVVRSAPPRMMR